MEVATRFALLLAKQTNWSSIKIAPLPKKAKKAAVELFAST